MAEMAGVCVLALVMALCAGVKRRAWRLSLRRGGGRAPGDRPSPGGAERGRDPEGSLSLEKAL